MSKETEYFLSDLAKEILVKTRDAQRKASATTDDFEKGRQMAFYEVLSLMKQQADAFGIDETVLGLKDVDLERLLT